jgi:hypothetical protein
VLITYGNAFDIEVDVVQVENTLCLGVLFCMCRIRKVVEKRGKGVGMWKKERN